MKRKKLIKEITLSQRIDSDLSDRLHRAALRRRVKRAVIVRNALEEHLKKLEEIENQKSLESVA